MVAEDKIALIFDNTIISKLFQYDFTNYIDLVNNTLELIFNVYFEYTIINAGVYN